MGSRNSWAPSWAGRLGQEVGPVWVCPTVATELCQNALRARELEAG